MIIRRSPVPGSEQDLEMHSQRIRKVKPARWVKHVGPVFIATIIVSTGCSGTLPGNTCNSNSVGGEGSASCATGGMVSTGGVTAMGGAVATGGEPSTGGTVTTGGEPSMGGAVTTGGEPSTGGAVTTGGEPSTGGTSSVAPQAILQYNFEDNTGTNATDSTPNHNDGTLTSSVVWSASGRNGNAVSFAGADSSVAMPTGLLAGSHALTISAWVQLTASAAENRLFYFGTGSTHLTLALNDSASPAGISLRYQGPTGGELVLTSPTQLPTTGVWKHVAVTLSSAGAAMYIDGKIVAQDNTLAIDPSALGATTTNLVGSSPTAQVFQGLIDEFYVYNYVLPLSEIRQRAWPKTDYTIYHLDEGTGTATVDSSDRAINGTLTGGPTWVASPFGTGVMLANSPATAAQQYVTLADGIMNNCTTAATFSAWINLTTNTTDAPVLEFGSDSTHYTSFQTYSTSKGGPVLSLYWINATKTYTCRQTGASYTLGQWTHIAAVRGANTNGAGRYEAVYENGVSKFSASNTSTSANFATPTPLSFLGKSQVATTPGFNGAIDEVLVSCRQYTDDEIKQLAYVPN